MLQDLASGSDIARLTDDLLRRADAYGRFPTPVVDLVAAAGLAEAPDGFLNERSIAQAPAHLRGILRRVAGKVHAVLDRKTREVHINPATDLGGQKAFKRLHETAHDLFPWQHINSGQDGFADDAMSLSSRTTVLFEMEANQGAAELLFQRERFAEIAAEYAVSAATIVELSNLFGASRHATFRRYVETHRHAVAGVVLEPRPCGREPLAFRRKETMCSDSWRTQFEDPSIWPAVLRSSPYGFVEQAQACAGWGNPLGDWEYPDHNNEIKKLRVEALSNSYRTFVLVWLPRREVFKRHRVIASAA